MAVMYISFRSPIYKKIKQLTTTTKKIMAVLNLENMIKIMQVNDI